MQGEEMIWTGSYGKFALVPSFMFLKPGTQCSTSPKVTLSRYFLPFYESCPVSIVRWCLNFESNGNNWRWEGCRQFTWRSYHLPYMSLTFSSNWNDLAMEGLICYSWVLHLAFGACKTGRSVISNVQTKYALFLLLTWCRLCISTMCRLNPLTILTNDRSQNQQWGTTWIYILRSSQSDIRSL